MKYTWHPVSNKVRTWKVFMDFGIVLNSFTKKEIDWQTINPILKTNPSDCFFNQFPLLLNDTIAGIELGVEGGMKTGRSVWEEKTNRKIWIRNGTVGCAQERERVREGVGGKGGEWGRRSWKVTEKETLSEHPEWWQRPQSKGWDRTKRHQQNRENKEKQEPIRSRFQKHGKESRESEKTVR